MPSVTLRPYQRQVVELCFGRERMLVSAPTGSGKSYMIAGLVRKLLSAEGGFVLVTVPTLALQDQIVSSIKEFVGETEGWKVVTLASLTRLSGEELQGMAVSTLIVDEAHHAGAERTFEALDALEADRVYGFTATPQRGDDGDDLMHSLFGPEECQVNLGAGVLAPLFYRILETGIYFDFPDWAKGEDYLRNYHTTRIKKEIAQHPLRNGFIVRLAQLRPEATLVLMEQKAHAEELAMMHGSGALWCHGGLSKKKRHAMLSELKHERHFTLYATAKTLGEGVDIPTLQNLIVASPFKSSVRAIQAAGRTLRVSEGKQRALILDLSDNGLPRGWVRSREECYRALGGECKEP